MCHAKVHGHNKPMTSRALTIVALAHKRANGEKTGGDVPFGYRVKGGSLSWHPEAVHQIIRRHERGHI